MAKGELRRSYRPGFADDVKALPTTQLREIVLLRLVDLSKRRLEGVPLEQRPTTGDLGDCRKLYFDETGGRRPDYRLVYRLLRPGHQLSGSETAALAPAFTALDEAAAISAGSR